MRAAGLLRYPSFRFTPVIAIVPGSETAAHTSKLLAAIGVIQRVAPHILFDHFVLGGEVSMRV